MAAAEPAPSGSLARRTDDAGQGPAKAAVAYVAGEWWAYDAAPRHGPVLEGALKVGTQHPLRIKARLRHRGGEEARGVGGAGPAVHPVAGPGCVAGAGAAAE